MGNRLNNLKEKYPKIEEKGLGERNYNKDKNINRLRAKETLENPNLCLISFIYKIYLTFIQSSKQMDRNR